MKQTLKQKIATGIVAAGIGLSGLVGGCAEMKYNCYEPQRQYQQVVEQGSEFPKGFFTGSEIIDKNQDGRLERNEIINLGKHMFNSGDKITFFGNIEPPYGLAEIVVYGAEDKVVSSSGEMSMGPSLDVIFLGIKIIITDNSPGFYRAKLYVNGREAGRQDITVYP